MSSSAPCIVWASSMCHQTTWALASSNLQFFMSGGQCVTCVIVNTQGGGYHAGKIKTLDADHILMSSFRPQWAGMF